MKNRILISLLLAFLPLTVLAQRIEESEAAAIAEQLLGKSVVNLTTTSTRAEQTKPFYNIYSVKNGTGFAIISTDRRAPKVIGYGDSKVDASNLPPQLKAILEKQDSVLLANPNLPEHSSWSKVAKTRADGEGGKLLKTANWGQGYPYNLLTPEIDGKPCITGCVATAMAILMKYYEWPKKGRGSYGYHDVGSNADLSFDYGSYSPDWENMNMEYQGTDVSPEQEMAVASLMSAVGIAVGMSYGIDASGSNANLISYNLFRHFKYEIPLNITREKKHSGYPDIPIEKWRKYLLDEIDANRPVLYSSSYPEEYNFYLGHLFVIDGYDNSENLHINWGWDGNSNGYYALGDFLGFNDLEQMILQIKPDYEATEDWQKINITDGSGGLNMNGGELDPVIIGYEDLKKGEQYEVTFPCILIDNDAEDAEVVLALTDKEGKIKDSWTVWNIEGKFQSWNTLPGFLNCQTGGIKVGIIVNSEIESTDSLKLFYKDKTHPELTQLRTPSHFKSSYPVVGNTPRYVNFSYEIDPELEVTFTCGNQFYTDAKEFPSQIIKGETVNIQCRSSNGYPAYYFNGERKIWGGLENPSNSYMYFNATEDATVRIENVKFSDLLDLNIHLETSGTLAEKISKEQAPLVNALTLTGKFNHDDLWFINRQLPVIRKLDLSNALISEENDGVFNSTLNTNGTKWINEILLPENTREIWATALEYLFIKKIIIPASVEKIGWGAFRGCSSLKSVVVKSSKPIELDESYDPVFFKDTPLKEKGTLYVPKGSKEEYLKVDVWNDFPNIIEYEGEWQESAEAEEILLNKSELSLKIGETEQLTATISPENTTDKTVSWTSSNERIATISSEGVVTAVSVGTATITATCGNVSAKCSVTVNPILVESIELNHSNYELQPGERLQLLATVLPENATNKEVLWSSSNREVVTVNSSGIASFVNYGDAVVTATAADGSGIFATCTFSSVDGIETITVDGGNIEVFTLDGKKVQNFGKGMFIIRTKDGKTKKVVKK